MVDALKYRAYYRIITDKEIPFPRNYECIKHDPYMEVSIYRWNDRPGWQKPDLILGDVEVYYLWKDI